MKPWFAAAAAAPLLVACASAGAQTAALEDAETRVLVINGERIVLGDAEAAASAIEGALERSTHRNRVLFEFSGPQNGRDAWSDDQRDAFEDAMALLSEAFGVNVDGNVNFEFDTETGPVGGAGEDRIIEFKFEDGGRSWTQSDGQEIEIHVQRLAGEAERHGEFAQRHAEEMARNAERMGIQMAHHGARAELHGLRAGVRGVEVGLEGIDRVLERGWYEEDGDRVTLTDEKRAELEESRTELVGALETLRADLARAQDRHGEQREVRILRRNGEARAWVNGEEVSGSELDRLLDGAPSAPEPPEAPEAP